MSQKRKGSAEAVSLALVAALLRLVPHPSNFAPMGGVSLFSGARVMGWWAYLIPILAMLVTDPLLSYLAGFPAYSWGTPVVYASLILNVLLGRLFLRHSRSMMRIGAVAFAGSLQFFILTNLAVWWAAPNLYAHNAVGLSACFAAALPFFSRTVAGDLFYSGVLFTLQSVLDARAHGSTLVRSR